MIPRYSPCIVSIELSWWIARSTQELFKLLVRNKSWCCGVHLFVSFSVWTVEVGGWGKIPSGCLATEKNREKLRVIFWGFFFYLQFKIPYTKVYRSSCLHALWESWGSHWASVASYSHILGVSPRGGVRWVESCRLFLPQAGRVEVGSVMPQPLSVLILGSPWCAMQLLCPIKLSIVDIAYLQTYLVTLVLWVCTIKP